MKEMLLLILRMRSYVWFSVLCVVTVFLILFAQRMEKNAIAAVTADPMPSSRPLVSEGDEFAPADGGGELPDEFLSSAQEIIPSQPPFASRKDRIGSVLKYRTSQSEQEAMNVTPC
jgi:hypothetical protein